MKLAFCLFKFFPYGGLERDFLRIAQACQHRKHEIHIYTMQWEGESASDFYLHLFKIHARQNHIRCRIFANMLKDQLKISPYDVVIGFNKIPYLDIYYAADVCYQARIRENRHFIYQLLPRYRQLIALEKAIFAQGQQTKILFISPRQQAAYRQYYQTELERFHLLLPGIAKDRIAPANANEIRKIVRNTYQLLDHDTLLLMIGSGFKTKGLDRIIHGLAALPTIKKEHCQLFVIGQDDFQHFQQLAKRLQVEKHVHFLGGRTDILNFLLAADLLIHPAYHENTGTVLLEAIVAGLPVLTTDVCGYAHYVRDAKAGIVLSSPFQQGEFNTVLENMISSNNRLLWKQNGLAFANNADIYDLPEKAADFIEYVGKNRDVLSSRLY
ncbi:MAG TPA: glycosyltransferase family 4 protein [Gammaproteobacteria bacterium]|nr:glycosyltransferase family 4 protein [Gammaproteobacteria bacterium]